MKRRAQPSGPSTNTLVAAVVIFVLTFYFLGGFHGSGATAAAAAKDAHTPAAQNNTTTTTTTRPVDAAESPMRTTPVRPQESRYSSFLLHGIPFSAWEVRHQQRSSIALLTLFDPESLKNEEISGRYRYILLHSLANKRMYSHLHGYDFIIDFGSWDTSRPVAWSKLKAMQQALLNYEWVVWMDIDTLVMNMEPPLELLADHAYDVVMTADGSGPNTGVWMARASQWSTDLLIQAWNQVQFLNETDVYEQRAVRHVMGLHAREEVETHVKILPQRAMNSYTKFHERYGHHAYQPGEFVVHFAGCRHILDCDAYMNRVFHLFYSNSRAHYEYLLHLRGGQDALDARMMEAVRAVRPPPETFIP